MTKLYVTITGAKASVEKTGPITTGMVGVPVECSFDAAWEGLSRLAVFRCGEVTKDADLKENQTLLPHEVLTQPDQMLYVGVEGRSVAGDLVIPTVWAEVGRVLSGAQAANDPALAPTPSQFDRLMAEVAKVREEMEDTLNQGVNTAAFLVTVDANRAVADKTNQEIYEVYRAQRCGYLLLVTEFMDIVMQPTEVTSTRAVFTTSIGDLTLVVTIENDSVRTEIYDLATRDYVNAQIANANQGSTVDLSGYAKKTELPTKVSQLENDSKYLTKVPDGYAKITDIPQNPSDIGAQPAGNYALKSEIPTVPVQSVNGKTGAVQLTASDVGGEKSGTADAAVSTHNTKTDAHNDIRLELKAVQEKLTAFFDSDDQTLDELSEIVAYITSNKSLIDSVTTSKVSVADIINNLTTNVANKPLSAAQGVALKALIDAITVPTKLSQLTDDATHRTVTDTEKSAWNGKSNFSGNYDDLSGKPTIPTVPTKVSAFTNDAGYLTEHQDISGKLDANKLTEAVETALAEAKAGGEFDGETGQRGTGLLPTTTAPSAYTTEVNGLTPAYRISLSTVKSQASTAEVFAGDTVRYSYYHYPVIYVDASYVYCGARVSIRGASGAAGKTPEKGTDYWTEADKAEMVSDVLAALPTWTGGGSY